MLTRIITHSDFDGVASAVLCSHTMNINIITFTQPRTISDALLSITIKDIVCDLPYPLECGMWFDHHQGNLEDLQYRKIDQQSIPGRFAIKDSCARVVYEYFLEKQNLPDHFKNLVDEADIIDSFNYQNIDDWRRETPGKIVDATTKVTEDSPEIKWQYLKSLVLLLKEKPLEIVATLPGVKKRYQKFMAEEQEMLNKIRGDISFLPQDHDQQLMIIDLTKYNRRPFIIKNLAYLIYPQALGVVQVSNLFRNNVKTNDLSFSISLSVNLNSIQHNKDTGEIMRQLNIGNGHAGAASGLVYGNSKDDMLKKKAKTLETIYKLFISQ